MITKIRLLTTKNASIYQKLRLTNFIEAPYAFSESYEDEVQCYLSSFEQELAQIGQPPEQYALGAFNAANELVGFVRFRRDRRSKARHKAMVYAM